MKDTYGIDRSGCPGWARFSDDGKKRYRLGRIFDSKLVDLTIPLEQMWSQLSAYRVVFLMLNPSTADEKKPDQTVGKCCKFAQRWGAQVVEVVNLFAFRTPYPTDLFKAFLHGHDIGACEWNDRQILEACTQPGVIKVIAAWGNHGGYQDRDQHVTRLLADAGVELWHLGMTGSGSGYPMHPLARGKNFIPLEREPKRYEVQP